MSILASKQASLWSHWIQAGFICKLRQPTSRMTSAPGARQQTILIVSLSINTTGTWQICDKRLTKKYESTSLIQCWSPTLKLSVGAVHYIYRLLNLELLLRFGSNARRRHNQSLEGHVHRYSALSFSCSALCPVLASLLPTECAAGPVLPKCRCSTVGTL